MVTVIGAGPAGCAAALTVLADGGAVTLCEKSPFPRHKVCGEFLAPEAIPVLQSLGVWPLFEAAGPARVRRALLHFGARTKKMVLPEPALSLSRFALDDLLLRETIRRGADFQRVAATPNAGETVVVAHGRKASARAGQRLFGFKAHFTGPVDDAVELFFFRGCYVGVSSVENGITNICGVAPESLLRECAFQPEALFADSLRERIQPLTRAMDWMVTGPLVFSDELNSESPYYLAGDALGFVDPFTGSGMTAALLTGSLAGVAAVRGTPVQDHLRACGTVIRRQYTAAMLLRRLLGAGLAEKLAAFVPGSLLYRMTRPVA